MVPALYGAWGLPAAAGAPPSEPWGTVEPIPCPPEAAMPRTVRPSPIPYRAGVAGASVVLLLTACGGNGGRSATDPPDRTDSVAAEASAPTAASGAPAFCSQAAGIDQRVDAALADRDGDVPSLPEVFRQIAGELRDIAAPAQIASDWEELAGGLDRMADAFADVDITDLDSLDALDHAEADLAEASTGVERYLDDECGI
jgi:hypothetical protein